MTRAETEAGIMYYARCTGIRRMGPYASELRAWAALMGHDGEPVAGATVWPEAGEQHSRDTQRKDSRNG